MARVLLGATGVGIVLSWAVFMFDVPIAWMGTEPSAWLLVGVSAFCTVSGLAILRFNWVAVLALPAIALFTAACSVLLAKRGTIIDPAWSTSPFTYGAAILLVGCATVPVAVAIAATLRQVGFSTRRCRWIAFGICCGPLVLSPTVNLVDYLPYGLALRRVVALDATELAALATAATRYDSEPKADAEIRRLKPIRVDLSRGSGSIYLYERGDDVDLEHIARRRFIYLDIQSSAAKQRIELVTFAGTGLHERVLWERNSDAAKQSKPTGRLVTVHEWTMEGGRDWIVLPNEVRMIQPGEGVGQPDPIVAHIPLPPEQRQHIEAAMSAIGPDICGHAFDGGEVDGIHVRISFSPDGSPDPARDIVLDNSCRSEVEPLFRAISEVVGQEHAITFADVIRRNQEDGHYPQMILTVAEYEHRRNPTILPWWCWWPRVQGLAD